MTRHRLAAAVALMVAGGAGVMLFALVAGPGSWWHGYVSEAGVAGRPYAMVYRIGLVSLAFGVALLGRVLRRAAVLLLVAAVLAGTSGVVPCSAKCPLPPYESTTPANLIHTAASIVGMAALAAAMAVLWWTAARSALRWLTGTALILTVPLGVALGLMMLLVGRATASAIVERLMLVVVVSWLVGTAVLARFDDPRTRSNATPSNFDDTPVPEIWRG